MSTGNCAKSSCKFHVRFIIIMCSGKFGQAYGAINPPWGYDII